jgi:hypothetical protein
MADFVAGQVLTATDLNNQINGATMGSATANFTLAASDAGKLIGINSSGTVTVTVPPASSVTYTAGAAIAIARIGTGPVFIAAGSGVTINSTSTAGTPSLRAQYSSAQLYERADNLWLLVGDLA